MYVPALSSSANNSTMGGRRGKIKIKKKITESLETGLSQGLQNEDTHVVAHERGHFQPASP